MLASRQNTDKAINVPNGINKTKQSSKVMMLQTLELF